MTSITIAIVIVAAILYGLFRFSNKEAHHLDDLHVAGSAQPKK